MSDMTRRDAMKLAAGTGLATAVGASAAADDHPVATAQGGTKAMIQAYVSASHGVTADIGGGLQVMADKPFSGKVEAVVKGDNYDYLEPTHKVVASFPTKGFKYLTICYSVSGVYLNAFYDSEAQNTAKWCCVTCPSSGVTVCGPGVCVKCGSTTICC